jgi:hypothetical protein
MLGESSLNLSQSLKVRKTKLGFAVTENRIRKQIPKTGRVYVVEMVHINDKAVHLRDSRSKKEVYEAYAFVIVVQIVN